jgi:hypothetical protein
MRYQHWISRKTGSDAKNRIRRGTLGGWPSTDRFVATVEAKKIPRQRMLRPKCHIAARGLQGIFHTEYKRAKKQKIAAIP